jgi:hypothetical protein
MATNQQPVPRLAALLGYAGLIPFVVLSAALWLLPSTYQVFINQALLLYASLILAFMGAVHWGLAMLQADIDYQRQLVISVIPALVAWLALFLPEILNYSVLIIAFALLCLFDTRMSKTGRAPSWYPRLRSPLTTVVVASLLVAQFQYLPFH